ncbi:cobalamin-independent methionine synthase II family protein [Hyphococcus luteus]|uniref:Epoxyalkane--coenzyme M transferase n=1 Tax=Hyphococcus luteus TaxID=2058213 RepID=A0A2S7KAQ1_9PROT|nr:cobalamin-independent methionine synthase II family protein [Marinicaulis flavus]PQA89567.1 epoxyalkane--coenzyme M transferase [Marinicaulis flavus]
MASAGRFLTTHVGSLPRPEKLIEIMFAREDGLPLDPDAVEKEIEAAVRDIVAKQAEAGIDVVNDGEMSKPSYATYIKDRLAGFGGAGNSYVFQDIEDFPSLKKRIFDDPGRKHRKTPACNGPISVKDMEAPAKDAARLNAAVAEHEGVKPFMSAASPGVTTLFFGNEYYDSHEDYLFAVAEGLRHEYETIAAEGITLQIDCPDLAMGRHTQYAHLDLNGFRDRMALHIEALNKAVANIPAEQLRMHMCWGNYPGPHHCDVPFKDIIDLVWQAKPHAILFEAANPRHAHEYELFENVKLPEGKVLIPGVIECQSNYIEHPDLVAQRIARYANLVGRENVMAGVDCGFSIHAGSGGVDPSVAFAKLAALAEGAKIASKQFWP